MDPSNLTPEESRRRDRYHESGHAIAAVIREGFVTSMDFSFEVETRTDLKKADMAFMAWAGPWRRPTGRATAPSTGLWSCSRPRVLLIGPSTRKREAHAERLR